MKKFNHQKELIKCYMLASTLGELAESGVFDMTLVTKRGKTIPTMGSMVLKMEGLEGYTLKCDKVITHNDGSFTGLYNGIYVKMLPFNYLTDKMYYGELK